MEEMVVVLLVFLFPLVFFGLISVLVSLSGMKKRIRALENGLYLQRVAWQQFETSWKEFLSSKTQEAPAEGPSVAPPAEHEIQLQTAPQTIPLTAPKTVFEPPPQAVPSPPQAAPPSPQDVGAPSLESLLEAFKLANQIPPPLSEEPPRGSVGTLREDAPPPPEAPPLVALEEIPPPPFQDVKTPSHVSSKDEFKKAEPDWVGRGVLAVKRWFTEGNVPVKIGTLVLLAGMAALLKYVVENEWLVFPMELRLASIAALALGGLVFAWRKRESHRAFALSLQGGAIGILLLTVFAAYKWYEMLPASVAMALSVALIAGAGVLAVVQNAKALAVFAVLAGFMAPIWLSTGSDNHVALFSYYALLNAAILGIAWYRSWRGLNLLGFAFTFGIGTTWGILRYQPEKFASTEPFLVLFFLFYLLIPILYARKRVASRKDILDGSLLFGTPLIAFILQAGLFEFEKLPSAFCALGLGVLYAALAAVFIKRKNFVALGQVYAILSVGFATLSIPLALSAQSTACVFALEGAGLVGLGLKQKRWLPQLTGVGLQLLAGFAFFSGEASRLWGSGEAVLFANSAFMSALLVALGGFASALCYFKAKRMEMATLFYIWGLAWWCGNAIHEADVFIQSSRQADFFLVFALLTGWLAAEAYRRWPALGLSLTTLLTFIAALPLLFWQVRVHAHPFGGYGLWAWGVFAALGFRSLVCLKGGSLATPLQMLWWLIWMLVFSSWLRWLGFSFALGEGWVVAGIALPWLLVFAASIFCWRWLAFPQGASFEEARPFSQSALFVILALWWLSALFLPAGSAPLPWIPLLNPLELAQLALLLLAVLWFRRGQSSHREFFYWTVLPVAGFIFISVAALRLSYHWGGFAGSMWSRSLWREVLTQTSLTVTWSILGVLGWIVGSRKGLWRLWLMGVVLLGAVLVKLALVDWSNLGNILGILSYIAYGILGIITGYFAPAPPRSPLKKAKGEEEGPP
ncbi:MAG: DUF2339 domain-containing protein [Cystobacterineae bacterium]|nr:DUF2339 domain-containing protein [Cystobacterineae bacterium]